MLIPLTSTQNKETFALSSSIIWLVERVAGNPLVTRVVTTMQNQKGLIAYEVWESPEDVVSLIAQAAGKPIPKLDSGLPAMTTVS